MEPQHDSPKLDTLAFGLTLRIQKPIKDRPRYRIEFDTGIILEMPETLFLVTIFHLEQSDPKSVME